MYFENLNVQQGLITGFEAGFGVQRQHYKIDISHSQIRGYNKTDGQPLADIPADKWILKLKGSIPNNNFTATLSHRYTSNEVVCIHCLFS